MAAVLLVRLVRAGPDIAKPVAEIAGLVGKWIADELLFGFFSRISFCKQGSQASCPFWDSWLVRPVSFCDGANGSLRKVR
ncbi:hypothetical protein CQ12_15740 [Bradyrhizobium jicamae]|uniref:Uncharacterized protein n=1 Tax=Bradyrhizobium jicamae TaxID=280332 RepID=A0A0R3LAG8_9BRAD|nr:hypothetical protein [Bradyrhizobium jicamae]KRR02501.1 hypothetical protein CQ12_15740 [Bradyrhizobium jicamae]